MRFTRAGKVTNAVAAMAGGEEVARVRENGPRGHYLTWEVDGEKEGSGAKLTER
jgi:hypothetical protein